MALMLELALHVCCASHWVASHWVASHWVGCVYLCDGEPKVTLIEGAYLKSKHKIQ